MTHEQAATVAAGAEAVSAYSAAREAHQRLAHTPALSAAEAGLYLWAASLLERAREAEAADPEPKEGTDR